MGVEQNTKEITKILITVRKYVILLRIVRESLSRSGRHGGLSAAVHAAIHNGDGIPLNLMALPGEAGDGLIGQGGGKSMPALRTSAGVGCLVWMAS